MKLEEFIIHISFFIILIVIITILVQVWIYLNNKALGMQTILDELAKDGMIFLGPTLIINWLTWINFDLKFNYELAIIYAKLSSFSHLTIVGQAIVFFIIRYMLVFHFEYMNSMDERKVIHISRISVFTLATLITFLDDQSQVFKVLYLTQTQLDDFKLQAPVLAKFTRLILLVVITFVQLRIVLLRRRFPDSDNKDEKDVYRVKLVSYACLLALVAIIAVAYIGNFGTTVIVRLLRLLFLYLMILIGIVLIVCSNDKMFCFLKKKFGIINGKKN